VSELKKDFEVTVYYDNSNISPKEEYEKRKSEAKEFYKKTKTNFISTEYNHDKWLEIVRGLESEPERGKRCILCYRYRLQNTAKYAKDNGYNSFSSTLSISPHKDSKILSNLGRAIGHEFEIEFIDENWKKKERFKRAMEFSHEHDFYHQDYCGCEFSKI
jgi:hypothetical protein